MRIALAQINSSLGDFKANAAKILEFVKLAEQRRVDLVLFPECCLFGYSPNDLLEYPHFVDEQNKVLRDLHKKIPAKVAVLIGVVSKNPNKTQKPYFNSAALLQKSKAIKLFHKTLLPTGDVFDEYRFFETGDVSKKILQFGKKKILITICEDIWGWPQKGGLKTSSSNPLKKIKDKVDLVVNLSGSPFHPDKFSLRTQMAKKTAVHFSAPLAYVNLVGSQDEIIFDGQSFALDKKGKLISRSLAFEENLNVIDFTKNTSDLPSRPLPSKAEMIRLALVSGIRDFAEKNNIKRLHLGLSGGIDSAVVACLAVDAVGPSNVTAIAMPGPFSSEVSLSYAQQLSKNLGIDLKTQEITDFYNLISKQLSNSVALGEFSLVHENLQARLRGLVLMAVSNLQGSLLLNTSNKSEMATGYSTLYGDMCGGLSPIGDLLKSQVYDLAKIYNQDREIIPEEIITRAPSAELRPNQKDQDSLPSYDQLDKVVDRVVNHSKISKDKLDTWLMQRLLQTEFKRWQAPPILKVSLHAFGRGRRFPITVKK